MRKTRVGILVAGGILLAQGRAATQIAPAAKAATAATMEVGGGEMWDAIREVARATGQPIGEVVASDDLKPCHVTKVRVGAGALTEALDWITAQCPEYTWAQDQVGIVVQPLHQTESVIDLPIRDFSLTNIKAFDAEGAVRDLPEVKHWLKANGLRELTVEPGSKWQGTAVTFSIDLHNVPLQAILNEIALNSGRMTWSVVWFDHDTYVGIYL